ncbi:MAG: winged helix DNA-binding domain-containing protein [Candidatus Dormibacteraceae bacterium]
MARTPEVLGRLALNRALLARQMLLHRVQMAASNAVERLVGMQGQAPNLPYVGLWARLEGFQHEELSRLVRSRQAVRTSLMRNTIHLVTTRDALRLKPLFQPLHERGFFRGSPWGRNLKAMHPDALLAAGREIMGDRPRTIAELAKLLAKRFPGQDALSLAYGVRYLLPMVFATPRGIWQAGGPVSLTTVEAWLGRSAGPPISPDDLVLRYLGAFGPASPADMRAWSGLAFRPAFERLRPQLAVFRDEHGIELFDLPRAPRPAPETKAPVRFLPDYDNILLAHSDRTRIMAEGRHLGLFSSNGIMKGSVLVDGFIRAGWRPIVTTGETALLITAFNEPVSRRERAPIDEEGLRLLDFLAPGKRHRVELGPVSDGTRRPPAPAAPARAGRRAPRAHPAQPAPPRPPSGSTASRRRA